MTGTAAWVGFGMAPDMAAVAGLARVVVAGAGRSCLLGTHMMDLGDDQRSAVQVSACKGDLQEDLDLAAQAFAWSRPFARDEQSPDDVRFAVQVLLRSGSPVEVGTGIEVAAATVTARNMTPLAQSSIAKELGRKQVLSGSVVGVESMGYKVRSGDATHHVSAAATG